MLVLITKAKKFNLIKQIKKYISLISYFNTIYNIKVQE